ncbi:PREDICTED: EF-hand domain-containing protein 1-like [Polistes canadensis]|uniref:EF-hand domain-containing protein 1-like n=1 Tax=Polistes canadensis TaxID=91411 RepID=UPI000718F7BC|nr:PREDICTED: EF-hand domain-containing protein 1-like [Polistes canadensis]
MESLPLIPGYIFHDPSIQDYRLGHRLDFLNGFRILNDSKFGIGGRPIDAASLAYIEENDPIQYDPSLTYGRVRDYGYQRFVPHYALFAQKCLRFKAFFRQGVFHSPNEHFRIRHVYIIYFLEDDTLCVMEPSIEDAGFSQGKLVKRNRIAKTIDGDYFHWKDLNIGKDICIYGIVYHIIDCDLFTREFLNSQGIDVGDKEDTPIDPYIEERKLKSKVTTCLTRIPDDTRRRFLEYDRMILSFNAKWNDDFYQIMYFLMDDTIAIRELHKPNNGKDPVVMLLKRIKVPKNWKNLPSSYPGIYMEYGDHEIIEYYTPKDFKIGETIFIFGKQFFLYGCDHFTRKYYSEVMRIIQPNDISLDFPTDRSKPLSEFKIPPHIKFGTPEDTYASCLSFRSKPLKKDVIRQLTNFPRKLRYSMKLDNVHPEDQDRDFILEYNLSEGTMLIKELEKRNSGRREGCFLKATLVAKPATDRDNPLYYTPQDFFIGAQINIFNHYFTINGADLFVYRYMEANPEKFSQQIRDNIRNYFVQQELLQNDIIIETKKIQQKQHDADIFGEKEIGNEISLNSQICNDVEGKTKEM